METAKEWGRRNEEERWPQTKPLDAHGSHWTWTAHLNFKLTQVLTKLTILFFLFFFSPFTPFTVLQNCRRKEPTTDGSRCVCCCCCCCLFLFICRGEDTSKAKKQLMLAAQRAAAAVNTLTHTQKTRRRQRWRWLQFLNVAAAKLSHNCTHTHTCIHAHTHFSLRRQVVKGNAKEATTKANRTRRTLNRN